MRRQLVEPLIGELRRDGVFPGGYTLERVEHGSTVELAFRAEGGATVAMWLRPASDAGGAYRTTRHFRVGHRGALDRAGARLLDALCDAVARNEAALFDAEGGAPLAPLPWEEHASSRLPTPPAIAEQRRRSEVACTSPYTTMEVTDPSGDVHQCCATWTIGARGKLAEGTLAELWNSPGYQMARRQMASGDTSGLCRAICPRLHDRGLAEGRFELAKGSERFVANQRLLMEELAARREVLRAKPLFLALCPSTYCNYDCIMCLYGRTPRRDLPESIWEQLPELLPTLHTLTLLGGEPLANPSTMDFLRAFDADAWPDARVDLITNGSLLTEKALRHLGGCSFGDVTVSLNAGTAAVYAEVQRGIDFAEVLANVDALLRFRATHRRPFQVTLSFVVQPANAHTLPEFGELARARGSRVRLLPLNPLETGELDFYPDPAAVASVLASLERFAAGAPAAWAAEIEGTRAAILAESARRGGVGARVEGPSPLPIVR